MLRIQRILNNFNSIKVRLKQNAAAGAAAGSSAFQFHKGTIKTHVATVKEDDDLISIP